MEIIGEELAIVWNDGSESFLPMERLRRHCPCASCSGEPDVLGKVFKPNPGLGAGSFTIRSLQTVGGYALQPTWGDGHSSGLFPFEFLRTLADQPGANTPPAASE
jgi:DUF971 family protein